MNKESVTIETYDKSADLFASYFAGIGSRVQDIEKAIELAQKDPKTLRVVEIGCGDGRDAAEIIPRVYSYEGFDPSIGLLQVARQNLPHASFKVADAMSYQYQQGIDVYFAFASLLHVNRINLHTVLAKVYTSLTPKGILYLSLKERPTYTEELQEDKFGTRMFYYYNPAIIQEIAGDGFSNIFEEHQTIGSTNWFTLALQKQ